MRTSWNIVNKILHDCNLILEILDARFPEQTRNAELEEKVRKQGKKLIYVINKCDLAPKRYLMELKKTLHPSVFVSARLKYGTSMLYRTILRESTKDNIVVGVVGYPNTGKSSVINALKGSKAARVSPLAGFTKAVQWVRISQRVMLMDSPGVIPYGDKELLKHVLISATDYGAVPEPDLIAMELIKMYKGKIEEHYGVEPNEDPEKSLEAIALKSNKLLKKGVPNIEAMSRIILKDWQQGRIRKAKLAE
jgi:hypothetical protein